MIKLKLLSTTLAVFISAPAFGQTQAPPELPAETTAKRMVSRTVDVTSQRKHRYWLYLPKEYETTAATFPLMLFLHGAGERGKQLDKVLVHGPPKQIAAGKELPFIVVAPQCQNEKWWNAAELSDLLDHIQATHRVDPTRVYATGLSMGGYGTWALAAYDPNRFAAIAPICGGGNAIAIRYSAKVKAAVWAFHGARDQVVPLEESEKMIAAMKQQGVNTRLTVYPDAKHDSWTATYDRPGFYDWFLEHKLQPQDR